MILVQYLTADSDENKGVTAYPSREQHVLDIYIICLLWKLNKLRQQLK